MHRRHVRMRAAGFGPPPVRRFLTAFAAAVAFACAGLPAVASGHATLVSMEPRPDSFASRADARRVMLRFTGPVDRRATQVEAVTADGRRIDDGMRVRSSPKRSSIAVRLRGDASGPVLVRWRTISPNDGHPAAGAFDFSIRGAGGATPSRTAEAPVPTPAPAFSAGPALPTLADTAVAVARVAQDAALALAFGLVVFLIVVWRRVVPPGPGARGAFGAAVEQKVHGLVLTAALAGVISALVTVALQGAVITNTEPWGGEAIAMLPYASTTKMGLAWIAVAASWLGVLVAGRSRPAAPATVALLAFLIVSPALRGHGGTMAAVVVLHVAAIAAWLGGLVALVVAQRFATRRLRVRKQGPFLARLFQRFGAVALPCAVIVLVTGLVQATVALGGPGELLTSGYGLLVAVKVALFAVLLLVAARTRLRLQPRLRAAAPADVADALRVSVATEITVAIVALGAAGLLAGTAPPS